MWFFVYISTRTYRTSWFLGWEVVLQPFSRFRFEIVSKMYLKTDIWSRFLEAERPMWNDLSKDREQYCGLASRRCGRWILERIGWIPPSVLTADSDRGNNLRKTIKGIFRRLISYRRNSTIDTHCLHSSEEGIAAAVAFFGKYQVLGWDYE